MKFEEECREIIKGLTGQDYLLFTPRGNYSLKLALKLVKSLEIPYVLTQDQGGWLTYSQYIQENNLKEFRLKTDYGLVNPKDTAVSNAVLLINSMPGYAALQDMEKLRKANEKILIINDASGSIGTAQAMVGDIILGSFAEDKPVAIEKGGFIATSNEDYYRFFKENLRSEPKIEYNALFKALKNLEKRLQKLKKARAGIIKDLKDYSIIHKDKEGINIIIKCNDSDKEKLINYCRKNHYEFTECPRYIRIMEKGISIEVKRLR